VLPRVSQGALTRARPLPAVRCCIVVGGTMSQRTRQAVAVQERPRIDVLELEAALGAQVYDFSYLTRPPTGHLRARLGGHLARRTYHWSALLAYTVLPGLAGADVVYATGEDVGFALAALLRTHRVSPPRLVVRLEQPTYGSTILRRTAFNLYMHYALERIDTIICRTNAHLQYLHSVARVPLAKLRFVPEMTDTRFYDPYATRSLGLRIAPQEPYILSAGLEMRDYPTLIEAVRGLPVRLIVAAASPWSHFRSSEAHHGDLPPNVTVSSFNPLQMRELYRHAAFVAVPVQPTLRACGMNVVLEGWAMAKGAVVTRTVGLPDYVREGENGLFVQPHDVADWRAKLLRLLQQPDEATRLGRNGRAFVEQHLNLDHYVSQIGAILQAAASREPQILAADA
jgi:glycosyltransferase involved in cell wall biosynthesis